MQSNSPFTNFLSRPLATILIAFLAVFFAAYAHAAQASAMQGKVVYVDDGDTVVLLTAANEQVKIRLASIDAPESSHTNKERGRIGQPFSDNAKRYLEQLVKGQTVDAQCHDVDRYSRHVCTLTVGRVEVNREMVRAGWAWANTASGGRYLRDAGLPQLQAQAQGARQGLWAGSNPVPPWEWRRQCWESGNCPQ
ncbi:thermonuclease family protein [Methylibium petroleiphilum]|uniref:Putative nuclease n=1 Tax=Methylibium petroleiphilum (strain ATCC BAA-1232 / LMG 22953 / PM1) TaxID=420662 RepID=A2SMY2_METPP|nr:thermonuclease family protein [Methylibium petroleiphilum]ABM96921.1 putative nuclease [Methylibium petroleiphilum PM1]